MAVQATLGNPRKTRKKSTRRKKATRKKATARRASPRRTVRKTRSRANPRKKSSRRKRVGKAARAAAGASVRYGNSVSKALPKIISTTAIIAATVGTASLAQGAMALKQEKSGASGSTKMYTSLGFFAATSLLAAFAAPKAPKLATGLALSSALTLGTLLFGKVKIDGQPVVTNALQARLNQNTGSTGSGMGAIRIRDRNGKLYTARKGRNMRLSGTQQTFGREVSPNRRLGGTQKTFGVEVAPRAGRGMGATEKTFGMRASRSPMLNGPRR